jgi:hypothetical protein
VVLDARLQQVGSLEKNFECQMSKLKVQMKSKAQIIVTQGFSLDDDQP